jgi:murein DD-endopeptidase MepM/ murein hydrolase activator NlpD
MLGISVLLLCCYGLYSSFGAGAGTSSRAASSFEQALPSEQGSLKTGSASVKKVLIGNKIKDACVSFFTSKNNKHGNQSIAAKNADVKSVNSVSDHGKFHKKTPSSSSFTSSTYASYKPLKSSQFSDRSVSSIEKRGDEYLLTKYDVGDFQEGSELIKWQSVKLALCKKEALQYKNSLDKLGPAQASKYLCSRIRRASGIVLSLHERYGILSKEEALLIGQLRNAHNLDLHSGMKYLSALDEVFSKIPVLIPQDSARITSHFGKRSHKKRITDHKGVDMTSPEDIVYCAADGRVEFCGWHQGYGNLVVINHGKFTTKYGHLRKICVSKGQFVTQGKKIAFEGVTGNARGRHLHFEVLRASGERIDPMEFMVYSMKVEQKINSDKIFAMQRLKCMKGSTFASNDSSGRKGKSPLNRAFALTGDKSQLEARVLLAGNERNSSPKKGVRARRAVAAKGVTRLSNKAHSNTAKALTVEETPTVAPKASFFGNIYRAIVPW